VTDFNVVRTVEKKADPSGLGVSGELKKAGQTPKKRGIRIVGSRIKGKYNAGILKGPGGGEGVPPKKKIGLEKGEGIEEQGKTDRLGVLVEKSSVPL